MWPQVAKIGEGVLQKTKPVAERVLADAWGTTVVLADQERLGGSTRSNVYRYAVMSKIEF